MTRERPPPHPTSEKSSSSPDPDRNTLLRWWQQADQEREQLQVSLEAALEQNEEQSKFSHDLEDRLRTSRRQVSKLTAGLAERDAELGRLKQSLREQGGGGSSLPSSSATVEEELRSALEELQITAEELQENNELLSQVNENLEERIAARTDELVGSNMGLQKALAERDLLLREVHPASGTTCKPSSACCACRPGAWSRISTPTSGTRSGASAPWRWRRNCSMAPMTCRASISPRTCKPWPLCSSKLTAGTLSGSASISRYPPVSSILTRQHRSP